jgi:hypothetical protein
LRIWFRAPRARCRGEEGRNSQKKSLLENATRQLDFENLCQEMEGCSRCTHYTHTHTQTDKHTHTHSHMYQYVCIHTDTHTHSRTHSLSLAQEKEGSSRAPINYHAMVAEKEEQKKTKDIQVQKQFSRKSVP